jgi:hypothetical protein
MGDVSDRGDAVAVDPDAAVAAFARLDELLTVGGRVRAGSERSRLIGSAVRRANARDPTRRDTNPKQGRERDRDKRSDNVSRGW